MSQFGTGLDVSILCRPDVSQSGVMGVTIKKTYRNRTWGFHGLTHHFIARAK
jgi:hypothetical protein